MSRDDIAGHEQGQSRAAETTLQLPKGIHATYPANLGAIRSISAISAASCCAALTRSEAFQPGTSFPRAAWLGAIFAASSCEMLTRSAAFQLGSSFPGALQQQEPWRSAKLAQKRLAAMPEALEKWMKNKKELANLWPARLIFCALWSLLAHLHATPPRSSDRSDLQGGECRNAGGANNRKSLQKSSCGSAGKAIHWAFATLGQPDARLFTALAREV